MKPYRGCDIEGYLESLDPDKQKIVRELRVLVHEAIPDATEVIKWGTLTFEKQKTIGAIMVHNSTVNLQLWRGAELKDKAGVLKGTGKGMRHIAFSSRTEIKKAQVKSLLRSAAKLRGA